ncbi:MAG TPA: proton-conducting transporter membrane subunit [Candidatus Sulfotelmatobacter sp.]|nr:proton-conducting transporter membrane subunit [Candidatus Sulfotelmatobacter sp.]HUI75549.1 proton-conducting transporter membrane subunit [Candidatus Acidoferrum sp.]
MSAQEWSSGALVLFFILALLGLVLCKLLGGHSSARALAILSSACSLLMMLSGGAILVGGHAVEIPLWNIAGMGALGLRLDMLSAIFLFTAGLVYLPVSLFAGNLARRRLYGDYPIRNYGMLHFALMISVVVLISADGALTFLIAWECMSILCYLLVNYEQSHRSDTRAAYILLAMGEAGFLAVVVAFLILGRGAADWSFAGLAAAAAQLSNKSAWAVFLLGFFGFGVKAGLVPVNFWLPRSYTAAPPIFVPVLAGVTLNLGFYGILRLNVQLAPPHDPAMGMLALVVGSVSALVGILYATTDNDMKTMLAHSSIENAGIIVTGIGAAMVFSASRDLVPAAIALVAALYHMVNHSVYKTLLFQGTGEIEATTGTREMDRLGGLVRVLPVVSVIFLVGCLSIAAVPPFNGFVSEWLTLQSLLRSAVLASPGVRILFALCGAALALTAALAVTCFVKVYAMSFLGIRRGNWHGHARERAHPPRAAMGYLAVACLLLGVLPTYVVPVLNRAVQPLTGASAAEALVPPFFTATAENRQLPPAFLEDFHNLGAQSGRSWIPGRGLVLLVRGSEQNPVVFAASPAYSLVALVIFLVVAWVVVSRATRKRTLARKELWAGGIPKLLPEMSYTATGFSNPVRVVFQAIFRPNIVEDTRETVAVHFRTAIHRRREETHLVDRLLFHPVGDAINWTARFLAGMHHGRLNAYVAYSVGFLLVLLLLFRLS